MLDPFFRLQRLRPEVVAAIVVQRSMYEVGAAIKRLRQI
jgi:hypothetical protein